MGTTNARLSSAHSGHAANTESVLNPAIVWIPSNACPSWILSLQYTRPLGSKKDTHNRLEDEVVFSPLMFATAVSQLVEVVLHYEVRAGSTAARHHDCMPVL